MLNDYSKEKKKARGFPPFKPEKNLRKENEGKKDDRTKINLRL